MLCAWTKRCSAGSFLRLSVGEHRFTRSPPLFSASSLRFPLTEHESQVLIEPAAATPRNALCLHFQASLPSLLSRSRDEQSPFSDQTWPRFQVLDDACIVWPARGTFFFPPSLDVIGQVFTPKLHYRRPVQRSACLVHVKPPSALSPTARAIVHFVRRTTDRKETSDADLTVFRHGKPVNTKQTTTGALRRCHWTDVPPDLRETRRQVACPVHRSKVLSLFSSCFSPAASLLSSSSCLDWTFCPLLALSRLSPTALRRCVSSYRLGSSSRARPSQKDRALHSRDEWSGDAGPDLSPADAARRLREIWARQRLTKASENLGVKGGVPRPARTGWAPVAGRPHADTETEAIPAATGASTVLKVHEGNPGERASPTGTRDGVSDVLTVAGSFSARASSSSSSSSSPAAATPESDHSTVRGGESRPSAQQPRAREQERRSSVTSDARAFLERDGSRNSSENTTQPSRQRGVVVKVHRHSVCGFIGKQPLTPHLHPFNFCM